MSVNTTSHLNKVTDTQSPPNILLFLRWYSSLLEFRWLVVLRLRGCTTPGAGVAQTHGWRSYMLKKGLLKHVRIHVGGILLETYWWKQRRKFFIFTFHNTALAQIFYDITVRLQIPSAYVDGWRSMVRCCWIPPPRWDGEKSWWRNVTYSETTMTLSLLEQCLYVHHTLSYIWHIYIILYLHISYMLIL